MWPYCATPDGKVYDGMCTEHYKDIDPKDICFMSKDPCIIYDKETDRLHINKKHSYYNQVQMQLALSYQTWCDFILYTSKGLVIDRVEFDEKYSQTFYHFISNICYHK